MADQNASKLGIASAMLKAVGSASGRLITSPFKGENGANTYFKDVMYAMLRTQLGNLDLAADRYMNGTTTPIYLKFAKDNNFAPESITLPSGTQAHWFGSSTAKKTIVYFHGGGYVLPCGPGLHLWLHDLQKSLGPTTSILLLAYSLAPEHPYPTQLTQAAELLHHLVHTLSRSPADLILGGDSAGGNLALALLSHIAHPHPSVDKVVVDGSFSGVMLISPWTSLTQVDTPSFTHNAQRDIFDARALKRWATAFLNSPSPYAGDFYSEPVLAAPEWWVPVSSLVDDVMIWVGDNEVLKDGILAFAEKFERGVGGGKVRTVVTAGAGHEEMIIERMLGYGGDSGTGSHGVVRGWVGAKL
ncbi:Alpha/Beta hydrolase protein [Phaeosphaeriaceae sp. PMI808]|nr:Alpha/Beta hydrolase protein [Phaeosphaeriaceae sp. PMI808]